MIHSLSYILPILSVTSKNLSFKYMLILGMTDYRDGTKEKVWQQYSVLMAAAVLKAIVEEMPPPK